MDGKYVLAAEPVVIVRGERSQFAGCAAETRGLRAHHSPAAGPAAATASRPGLLGPLGWAASGHTPFPSGRAKEGAGIEPSPFPRVPAAWLSHLSALQRGTTLALRSHLGLGQLLGQEGPVTSQHKSGSCQAPRAVNSLSGFSSKKKRKLFHFNHSNCKV